MLACLFTIRVYNLQKTYSVKNRQKYILMIKNNVLCWYKTRLHLNGLANPHVFSLNNGYVHDDRAWRVAFYFKVKPFLWNSVIVVCVISCIIVAFGQPVISYLLHYIINYSWQSTNIISKNDIRK